jgi:hypothetical protein
VDRLEAEFAAEPHHDLRMRYHSEEIPIRRIWEV